MAGDRYRSLPDGVRPVGASLGDLSKRFGLAAPTVLNRVFERWPELVGDVLANHVQPTGLRDGILRLRADEPAWAVQIRYLGTDLVDTINERLGEVIVEEIVISVRGVPRPRGRSPQR
jgi:predicted nucleic acid-binding Zn ribbon protein